MLQTISTLALHHDHVDGVAPDINCRQPTIAHRDTFVRPLSVGELFMMGRRILTKRSFQRDECRPMLRNTYVHPGRKRRCCSNRASSQHLLTYPHGGYSLWRLGAISRTHLYVFSKRPRSPHTLSS